MSVLADRAVGLLEYLRVDPISDALLEGLVRGLLDPAERLSLVAHGDGGAIAPWQIITDPSVAQLWSLPHASQWTGGVPPRRAAGETDDDYLARARAEVVSPRGMRRGSSPALAATAQPYLTGTKTVRIAQRLGGSVWEVGVLVFEAEVIDIDELTAAVNDPDVITAGMRAAVDYLPTDFVWTIAELESTYIGRTILDLESDYATVLDLENNTPG